MRHYEFIDFGAADAFKTILAHDAIAYEYGVGPGCMVISINKEDEQRARETVSRWNSAMHTLLTKVVLT